MLRYRHDERYPMTMSTPADAVRRLIARSIAAHEAVAATLGINPTDLRCLQLIAEEPDLTPSRLAELSGLTSGAVTGVLDRLERERFVRRDADPDDRRRVLVRVDAKRMAEMAAAYRPLLDSAVATTEAWGEAARTRLPKQLDGLGAALAAETERLWASARGGMVGNTYLAPVGDARRARLSIVTSAPRVNLGGAALGQQVRMVAETAATRLTLVAGDPHAELVRADFVGPPPDMRTADGAVTIRYRRRMIDPRSREIRAAVNPSLPWSVEIDGGLTDLDADLQAVPFAGLAVRGGVNHLTLRLPRPDGTVRLSIEGGSSRVRIARPTGIPMAIAARGGVARLRFDDQRVDASGSDLALRSPGFATTPDRYELDVRGGVSDLEVREE